MSWRASGYAKGIKTGPKGEKITRSEKLVLLVLADYYNDSYRCAWPKIKDLAAQSLLSDRRVREVTRSLQSKGVITIEERRSDGAANLSNLYRFPILNAQIEDEEKQNQPAEEGAKSRRVGGEKPQARMRTAAGSGGEATQGRGRGHGAPIRNNRQLEPTMEPPEGEAQPPPAYPDGLGEHFAVRMFYGKFGAVPSLHQQEQIEQNVNDVEAWSLVLNIWAGNGHVLNHVWNMIDRYKKESEKLQAERESKAAKAKKVTRAPESYIKQHGAAKR